MSAVRTESSRPAVGRRLVHVALAIAISGIAAHAHHSVASVYDHSQKVTVDGVVKEFHFVNPHPFVLVDVKDAAGVSQQWQIEMDNRWELVEIGMTAKTLGPGDGLIITGSRARGQSQALCATTRSTR